MRECELVNSDECSRRFRILALDGGGSKGMFSLGVLREIEALLGGQPLYNHFDLIYGTSTGAIIASALGMGMKVDEVTDMYTRFIPQVMPFIHAGRRSKALHQVLHEIWPNKKFDDFLVDVGIVTANFETLKPTIFKSNVRMAHGSRESFCPGFGVLVADAVEASCSAYPFFAPKIIDSKNQGKMKLVDGGFVANSPAMFAILDAVRAFKYREDEIRVINVGVGVYPERKSLYCGLASIIHLFSAKLLGQMFSFNSNTMSTVFSLYCSGISQVRLDKEVSDPALSTSLFETRSDVLNRLMVLGRNTYGENEKRVREVLDCV